jgi:hypothetical protein
VKKPYVLYAPKDYSSNPSVNDFVNALNSSRTRGIENMEASIRLTIEEAIPKIVDEKLDERDPERIVAEAVRSATADFRKRSLRISYTALDATQSDLWLPVTDGTTVQELLDEVWAAQRAVPAYSYGRDWILYDSETMQRYTEVGSSWARQTGTGIADRRRLGEVGIRPGAHLVAARLG